MRTSPEEWRRKKDCSILLYGFDFSSFIDAAERTQIRRSLQLNPSYKVIGHVGRFDTVKNHPFLLRTFARVAEADPELGWSWSARAGSEPDAGARRGP